MSAIEEEEEILLSIFPEEFTKLNDNTFKIRIDIDPSETQVSTPPTLFLISQLPSDYPSTEPILHIELSTSDDAEALTSSDRDELLSKLQDLVQESLGTSMIFTLVSALKEETILLLDRRITEAQESAANAAAARERAEAVRFEGTKVTVESFLAWNAKFKAEQAKREKEEEEARKAGLGKGERRLTGRQMFEGDKELAQSDAKIGEATDVEFDFSKFGRTTRVGEHDDEEVEVRHWAAE